MSSAVEMIAGGVLLVLLSFAVRERTPDLHMTQSLWAIGFLIVFGSLVGFCAYGYLLRTVRPALATSYAGYVNPMIAVALGIAVDGEHITIFGVLAMLIILTGVALVSLGRTRKRGYILNADITKPVGAGLSRPPPIYRQTRYTC